MGKIFDIFWMALMYYHINAWLKTGGMLPKYASWCGLEVYRSVSDCVKLFLLKMVKNIESVCMEDQAIYIPLISFIWVKVRC